MNDSNQTPTTPTPSRPKGLKSLFGKMIFFYRELSLGNKIVIWIILAMIPAAPFAAYLLKPLYKTWKQDRALEMVARYRKEKDGKAVRIAFEQAIRANPVNPKVWLALADYLDESKSPDTVEIWRRLSAIEPDNASFRFRYIEMALKYDEPDLARRLFQQLPDAMKTTPSYARVAAAIATLQGDFPEAEKQYVKALQEEPENADLLYDLVLVRMRIAESQKEAFVQLQEIAKKEGPYQVRALRELIQWYGANENFKEAQHYATLLVMLPNATFSDRILKLNIDSPSGQNINVGALRTMQVMALKDPASAKMLAEWMMSRGLLTFTEQWLNELPESFHSSPLIRLAQAELANMQRKWPVFFKLTREGALGAVSPKVIDLLEQTINQAKVDPVAALEIWKKTLRAAKDSPDSLQLLVRLSKTWNWSEALKAALWVQTESSPRYKQAWLDLISLYTQENNYDGVRDALAGLIAADPENLHIKNNWAMLCLLTRRDVSGQPLELSKLLYQADPTDPSYVATYAYALLCNEKPQEALRVMQTLPAKELLFPNRALFYGAILARNGKGEEAQKYLQQALNTPTPFIKEEVDLYDISIAYATGKKPLPETEKVKPRQTSKTDQKELMKELEAETKKVDVKDQQRLMEEFRTIAKGREISPEQSKELLKDLRKNIEEEKSSPTPIQKP